jgi:hypothetical protein
MNIAAQLEPLHPPNDTSPGEVLLDLAADALDVAGASRDSPLEFKGIRQRYLPESLARTKAQHQKSEFALRAAGDGPRRRRLWPPRRGPLVAD